MSAAGALLLIVSAVWGYLIRRRCAVRTLQLIRALTEDLGILRCRICVHCRPLPEILKTELSRGAGGACLWEPFAKLLSTSECSLGACWADIVETLPGEVGIRLAPLGQFLSVGGESLARAIDEAREELAALYRERQEKQGTELKLTAAVYFSFALLFILTFA